MEPAITKLGNSTDLTAKQLCRDAILWWISKNHRKAPGKILPNWRNFFFQGHLPPYSMSTATALLQELEWLRQHGQSQSNVVGISGLVKFLYTTPVVTTVKIVTIFISYFLKPFLIQDLLILPCTLSPHVLFVMVREFKFCFSSYDYPGMHLLRFT